MTQFAKKSSFRPNTLPSYVITDEEARDDVSVSFDGEHLTIKVPCRPADHPTDPRRVIFAALAKRVPARSKDENDRYFPQNVPYDLQLPDGRVANLTIQLQAEGWLRKEDIKPREDLSQRADITNQPTSEEVPLTDKDGEIIRDKEGNPIMVDPKLQATRLDAATRDDDGDVRE